MAAEAYASSGRLRARFHPARQMRLLPAIGAGLLGGLAFVILYYATLAALPPAFAYPTTSFPFPAWAQRFDLAQFLGTLLYPPIPTPLTWLLGLLALFGLFAGGGVAYALLLSWAVQYSDVIKGIVFGVVLFLGLALFISVANALHPAIMRNALPDTGLLLLGWDAGATGQLLILHILYGAILGALYRRWTVLLI